MAATVRQRGEVYAPPRYDAYVVLLIISLVAMILACALLWADAGGYPDGKAPTVPAHQLAPPGGGAGAGVGGVPPGGGAGAQGGAPVPGAGDQGNPPKQ
jgi:hypothetical protein